MKQFSKISRLFFALTLILISCAKEVPEIEVTEVKLSKVSGELCEGESLQLTATIYPENAADKTVSWLSSDTRIATVNDGLVTAISMGTVKISAIAGNVKAVCEIIVTPKVIRVERVDIDKTNVELLVGGSCVLKATITPSSATDQAVVWSSSDNSVAVVQDGKVSAVAVGKAVVTASAGDKSAECVVSVVATEVESITLNKYSLDLKVGETEVLVASVQPDDATDKTVIWTSSDESVAIVNNGEVQALNAGSVTISALAGNKKAECVVNISAIEVESVTLNKSSLNLKVGEAETLVASIQPDDATDKNVIWSSSDESVAIVNNGEVHALSAGYATISALAGNKKAECVVNVTNVEVESISLDKSTVNLEIGESITLVASVLPSNATDKTVKWSSSDESIAIVNEGVVEAKTKGTAIIYAKSGAATAQCSVVVKEPNGVIYYTSSNNMVVDPYNADAFGTQILSNTYENGKGVITFDGAITKIGESAFYKTKLTSVVLPNGILSIDAKAFCSCYSLGNVEIPSSVTTLGDYAFYQCYSSDFTTINIPSSVKKIGNYAFADCSNLCVTFNEGVEEIGEWAFSDCKVDEVILPNSLKTMGIYAFENSDVKALSIGDGLAVVPQMAFYNCRLLRSVSLGKSVTTIDNKAFENCKVLSDVSLPEGLVKIGEDSFRICASLESIKFPSTLQEIGKSAFYSDSRNTRLSSVVIPASVKKIGPQAFTGCSNLKTVTFEEGFTEISEMSFQSCGVETIVFPESLTSIGDGAFNACYSITEIILPSNVVSVGASAFLSCKGVVKLVLNNKLTTIGSSAFSGCKPSEAVVIPESVIEIGSSAFVFNKVSTFYFRSLTPPICKYDSFDTNYSKTLYVPNESLELYKSASGWNQLLKYIVGYDL